MKEIALYNLWFKIHWRRTLFAIRLNFLFYRLCGSGLAVRVGGWRVLAARCLYIEQDISVGKLVNWNNLIDNVVG